MFNISDRYLLSCYFNLELVLFFRMFYWSFHMVFFAMRQNMKSVLRLMCWNSHGKVSKLLNISPRHTTKQTHFNALFQRTQIHTQQFLSWYFTTDIFRTSLDSVNITCTQKYYQMWTVNVFIGIYSITNHTNNYCK